MRRAVTRLVGAMVAGGMCAAVGMAEPIAVRYPEGTVHGFLAISDASGKLMGSGALLQTVHRGMLTSRLVYWFKDGSVDDDTAVFTQHGTFRLVSDHHVQRGPIFKGRRICGWMCRVGR